MLLSVAHLSRPTFYDEIKRMKKGNKCASVKREIQAIFKEHRGRYGYRRITAELENRKIHCNHKVVSRLMKELGLVCRVRMKKYRSYKGEMGQIAPNLLERNFTYPSCLICKPGHCKLHDFRSSGPKDGDLHAGESVS